MRLVIQRVNLAKVSTGGKVVGEIGKGLFLLVGVGREDKVTQISAMAQKCVNLRLMADSEGKMNLSVKDAKAEMLVVSQFTLYADTSSGRRPSFVQAATPEVAEEIYQKFVKSLESEGIKVETGRFGSYMNIEAELDGPVTIILDSSQKAAGKQDSRADKY